VAPFLDRLRKRPKGAARLERALTKLKGDQSIERRRPLYEAVLKADLAVPVAREPETGSSTDGVEFLLASSADGEPALAVFTEPEALHNWSPEASGAVAAPARELFAYFIDIGATALLVNPGTPEGRSAYAIGGVGARRRSHSRRRRPATDARSDLTRDRD
jgi:hypothetical protein